MGFNCRKWIPAVAEVIRQIGSAADGTIGDCFHFRLDEEKTNENCFVFLSTTENWMRNATGTLHGGIIATIADQAMGQCAYCMKPGSGIVPSIELQVHFHRAFQPKTEIQVNVYPVSVTKSVMSFRAELFRAEDPDKLCASASGTYLYKSM